MSCLVALGYETYYRCIKATKKSSKTLPYKEPVNESNPPILGSHSKTPVMNNAADQKYLQGITEFSFEVLKKKIEESDTENQLISPLGISFLLSFIKHGLALEDQEEIERLIHLPKNSDEMKTSALKLIQKLIDNGLDIVGLVYINSKYRLNADYQNLVSDHYKCRAASGSSADEVNDWVKKATNGKIKEIIRQEDLIDFFVLLANAIHFKASWAEKFREEKTDLAEFTTPSQKIKTKMMHKTEDVKYFEDDKCQAIRLPYNDKSEFSMLLILPKKENDFSFVNASSFGEISQKMKKEEIDIALPKFKLEQKTDVKEMLRDMGVSHLFGKPDFSPMIDLNHPASKAALSEISIIKMEQKTVLVCDEEGTEASAVTVAELVLESMSCPTEIKEIKFNRPFLAALVTKEAPVLFGVIRDPSEKKA